MNELGSAARIDDHGRMRRVTLVVLPFVLAACGDPAQWRPAKTAKEYPSTKAAYRVQRADDTCESIGVVHAEGSTPLDDISTTAARHGGTHYVVRDDRRDYSLETRSTATEVTPGFAVGRSTTRVREDRATWAEVFRCAE